MKARDYHVLAEARILEARARGVFDDLPGAGKPLPADPIAGLPSEARVATRVAVNSGAVPLEAELQREIAQLRAQLAEAPDDQVRQRLRDLEVRLAVLHERSGRHLTAGGLTFVP